MLKKAQRKQEEKEKNDRLAQKSVVGPNPRAFSSKEALRKATYRGQKGMPKSSDKYVDVLTQMVNSTSPRKKQVLKSRCILSPKSKKRLNFLVTSFSSIKEAM